MIEKVNIGEFTEPVTLQQPTATTATNGQKIRSFADFVAVFAAVKPVVINETEVSARVQYSETYAFTTHNNAAVNSRFQVKWNDENFNIIKIERFNLGRFMRITAAKIVT